MKRAMVIALLLAGCDAQTTQQWVGQREQHTYATHGTPTRESRLGDGSKSASFPIRNMYGQVICERNFMFSPAGYVTSASTTCL